MPDPIAKRLAALPELSKTALCDLWKQLFNSSPSPKLRRDLMILILGYRLQEQAFGSLSAGARGRLRHLSLAFERDSDSTIPSAPPIRPGTRLVRQWRDQVHLVNVEANGYEYQGARYQSLSEIARLITGTRWSGPLFFGTKNEQTSRKSTEQLDTTIEKNGNLTGKATTTFVSRITGIRVVPFNLFRTLRVQSVTNVDSALKVSAF